MPFKDIEVIFTLTVDDYLFQFLGVLHNNCRIFLVHTVECLTHLLLIALTYRLDGGAVLRGGKHHRLKSPVVAWCIQCMVGLCVLKLDEPADVTCLYLGDTRTVLACTDKDLRETFLCSVACIDDIKILSDLT